jgi:hypothetical protein
MAFGKLQVRDERLYDKLAETFLQCGDRDPGAPGIRTLPAIALINIIHAFTKVHIAPVKLFGAVMRALLERPDELTTRDAVKLLHALAKVDYAMLPPLQQQVLQALAPERLGDLGVFELLKLAAASRKLGLEIHALEAQVGAVLPNEPQSLQSPREQLQRRPAAQKVRWKSARKQKWTW